MPQFFVDVQGIGLIDPSRESFREHVLARTGLAAPEKGGRPRAVPDADLPYQDAHVFVQAGAVHFQGDFPHHPLKGERARAGTVYLEAVQMRAHGDAGPVFVRVNQVIPFFEQVLDGADAADGVTDIPGCIDIVFLSREKIYFRFGRRGKGRGFQYPVFIENEEVDIVNDVFFRVECLGDAIPHPKQDGGGFLFRPGGGFAADGDHSAFGRHIRIGGAQAREGQVYLVAGIPFHSRQVHRIIIGLPHNLPFHHQAGKGPPGTFPEGPVRVAVQVDAGRRDVRPHF